MVYRFIRQFLNQERMIQQMADSSVVRGAARIFVATMFGVKRFVQESKTLHGVSRRAALFSNAFKQEFQKSLTGKK